MRFLLPTIVATIACAGAVGCAFVAPTEAEPQQIAFDGEVATAVFAGGCFWCVESDFDKVDGVYDTISGYSGGNVDNPTYEQVTHTDTGHYEVVKVSYDPAQVSYDELLNYYIKTVDPTDARGQFCDKGDSYRTAIFAATPKERAEAEALISEVDASGELPGPVVTKVLDASAFWPAEDYHQDYYKKNPLKYRYYRNACGRDNRLEKLWGEKPNG